MMTQGINDRIISSGFARDEQLIMGAAFVFLSTIFLIILVLFASRIIKTKRQKREVRFKAAVQRIINKIIVNESLSMRPGEHGSFGFYLAELERITGKSSIRRQMLIHQLLENGKNLTGASSKILESVYHALNLHRHSMQRLSHRSWPVQAMAIRELAEMNCREAVPRIAKTIKSGNRALQEEGVMALVRLESDPLTFLRSHEYELTPWVTINMFHQLCKMDSRKLPIFSRWFGHSNASVAIFALKMARHFRQFESLPEIANLVYHRDIRLVKEAVAAIAEMEVFQYRAEIARLARHAWRFGKLCAASIGCLGRIGNPNSDIGLIRQFLLHPAYEVRFESVKALYCLGDTNDALLDGLENENRESIRTILQHTSSHLLS